MAKYFMMLFCLLFAGCADTAYNPSYIISDTSQEKEPLETAPSLKEDP